MIEKMKSLGYKIMLEMIKELEFNKHHYLLQVSAIILIVR
jgi:hypothetical protein